MKKLAYFLVCIVAALAVVVSAVVIRRVQEEAIPAEMTELHKWAAVDEETEAETETPFYKEMDDGARYVDIDMLPDLLNDYYSGNGKYIEAASRDRGLEDLLGWRDIDASGHGVCFYVEAFSGEMHKFHGVICKTDNGGKTWFRAGESIFSSGNGFMAWVDNTFVRFFNSDVTGCLLLDTLKAADMRISDSEYLPVDFKGSIVGEIDIYKEILSDRIPENVSSAAYADDKILPVLLSNTGKELLIGFQYYEPGYDNWSGRREKRTEDGCLIRCYDDYYNTDLPFCFIGKFNADMEVVQVVYEDDDILNRLAAYSIEKQSALEMNKQREE